MTSLSLHTFLKNLFLSRRFLDTLHCWKACVKTSFMFFTYFFFSRCFEKNLAKNLPLGYNKAKFIQIHDRLPKLDSMEFWKTERQMIFIYTLNSTKRRRNYR